MPKPSTYISEKNFVIDIHKCSFISRNEKQLTFLLDGNECVWEFPDWTDENFDEVFAQWTAIQDNRRW